MISSEQFFVAVGAVVPLFILMFTGLLVHRNKLLTDVEINHVNGMVFKTFFSVMMFYNMYTTNLKETLRLDLIIFSITALAIVYAVSFFLVCRVVPGPKQRGAMIQAIYRSNFVLMGVPLVGNIFGENNIALTTMMIAIIIPLYNVLAVFTLETFRGGKFDLLHVAGGVLRNPMIIGAIVGCVFLLLGVQLPKPILKPLGQMSAMTSPLALIILGASFRFSSVSENPRYLVSVVLARLIIVPALVFAAAIYWGFRGQELVTLLAIFGTPCAVASFSMAQLMDSDADLAGNCVVFTSALSCVTLFIWLLFFAAAGYL